MRKVLAKVFKFIFSRSLIIILMILLQIAVLAVGMVYLNKVFPAFMWIMYAISAIILLYIANRDEPAEFKLIWAVIMVVLPVVGVLLFSFHVSNWGMLSLKKKVDTEIMVTRHLMKTSDGTRESLKGENRQIQGFSHFMEQKCGYPTFRNARLTYYPIGEECIEAIKEELKTAKKYIFMEYFIISQGQVWDEVLEILRTKVEEGVEVKVMYDGLCSLLSLPYHYPKKLQAMGIDAKMFAPIIPFLSTTQNNRDHRKILVIDGRVAFTGGINMADEYANLIEVYGHWKDVGIKIEGRAVMSMTRMFIQNWNLYGKVEVDYEKYLFELVDRSEHFKYDGYIIPYADAPTINYEIGKSVYSELFRTATSYVHVMMPYFIVDREFFNAIRSAALRGVDVKLILPHIPDKKSAFAMARSSYPDLLEAGVKVYEYTPGFVHAKVAVADDKAASVGSVNLDYRSFYHHFENGIYLYDSSVIADIEKDFQDTLLKSREVDMEYYKNINVLYRAAGVLLRLVAPLM